MPQLSVKVTLYEWVTQDQYNTLDGLVQGLLEQFGHLFSNVIQDNVPPSVLQIPIIVKVGGLSISDAEALVAAKMNTGFGNPVTAPVIEINISPPL